MFQQMQKIVIELINGLVEQVGGSDSLFQAQ